MKFKNYALLCLIVLLAVTACKKTSAPKPGPGPTGSTGTTNTVIDTDVYVLGTTTEGTNTVVAYWKNGEMTELSDKTKNCLPGHNIIVNGSDVYATGYYRNGSVYTPVYWKIGQTTIETPLTIPTDGSLTFAITGTIAVSNNSVYVAGTSYGPAAGERHAIYWNDNNPPVRVSGANSNGYAVAVNGTEVDVAGDAVGISTYWKGSAVVQPSTDGLASSAAAMVVNGPDTYTAGNTYHTSYAHYGATYWKNGVPTYVTDGSDDSYAQAIAVQNNDVLTVGYVNISSKARAFYWKNDTESTKLDDGGATNSGATGIALLGNNDIYICGSTTVLTTHAAVYWKNGKLKTPLPGGTTANGIAVVTHPH